MYDAATMERLEAVDSDGERLPEARVVLTNVSVQPVVDWWQWLLTGAWGALIVAGVVVPMFVQRCKRG
jgi:hypothetical protein